MNNSLLTECNLRDLLGVITTFHLSKSTVSASNKSSKIAVGTMGDDILLPQPNTLDKSFPVPKMQKNDH